MQVHIHVLRSHREVLERLQRDGWELEKIQPDSLSARHRQVASETAARSRLYALGLLTSSAVCIAFHETASQQ
jgi:hypothetical protein